MALGLARSGLWAPANNLLRFNFNFIASTYIVHPSFYSQPLLKAYYISTILRLDKRMMMMMMIVMLVRRDDNENKDVIIRN